MLELAKVQAHMLRLDMEILTYVRARKSTDAHVEVRYENVNLCYSSQKYTCWG